MIQFVIRRANADGARACKARASDYPTVGRSTSAADAAFVAALWEHFGENRSSAATRCRTAELVAQASEVVAAEDPFDPASYEALLRPISRTGAPNRPRAFGDHG